MVGQEAQKLLARLIALDDLIADVGPVEAGGEDFGSIEPQPFDDIVAGMRIGRCRQRYSGNTGILLAEPAELTVFRPEIMAPLRNAILFTETFRP
ncbi:UNVERIFIED_ORG: hypothetical protein GGE55_001657 [Rhizobium esperanzae]